MPRRSLEDAGKRERANAAKAANARERNIAQQYLNAGPSIGNLARAAYHWYNSVPMLGGQNENGLIIIKGDVPTPGMRSSKAIAQSIKTITKANAAKITPAQWTAAQDAAIARGDMAEAQRLRGLHFTAKAPETKQRTPMFNASGESTFNEFNGGKTGLNWFSESEKYAANHGVPRAFYINEPDIYLGNVPAWIKGTPTDKRYIQSLRKLGYTEEQIAQKVQSINEAASSSAPAAKSVGMGSNNELVTRNNNTIKLADAVTYDDNGVRIPLGLRDNFNINDIRYGLIPLGIIGTGYGAYNSTTRPKHKDGGIHIAPSKRGTFTAAATKHGLGVQEFASRVLRNKDSYSPAMIKKANFARNASKWN